MVTHRVPRDVSVHLFRAGPLGAEFLMLRRTPERGGFWQGITGAPLEGESDAAAAVRETRAETGLDVRETLVALGLEYAYGLDPARAGRWADVYGRGVTAGRVFSFGARVARWGRPGIGSEEPDA